MATRTRAALIAQRRPFIAETVFSHPSKLALITDAHAGGYTVIVHVLLVPEDLAVERVRHRVRAGGHGVPPAKIRQRYRRLWPLVTDAMARADTATVYDNSRLAGPRIVAQLSAGLLVGAAGWPGWTPEPLRSRWPD